MLPVAELRNTEVGAEGMNELVLLLTPTYYREYSAATLCSLWDNLL